LCLLGAADRELAVALSLRALSETIRLRGRAIDQEERFPVKTGPTSIASLRRLPDSRRNRRRVFTQDTALASLDVFSFFARARQKDNDPA